MALMDYITEFARENKISKELAEQVIKEALLIIYKKLYGKEYSNVEIEFTKKIEMFQIKTVVEKVKDKVLEISKKEAEKITKNKNVEIGTTVKIPIDTKEFSRQFAQIVKQVIKQKIADIHKDVIYNEFKNKVGELVVGKIKSVLPRKSKEKEDKKSKTKISNEIKDYYVSIEPKDTEAFLPAENVIPDEEFDKGDIIKAILVEVKKATKKEEPQLILSRNNEEFVRELLKMNIPEISDGTFQIKAIARNPGEVTKLVIHTNNPNVDPVSVTVGKQGTRIKPVRAELGTERLEIIKWSEDPRTLIKNAVTSSRVLKNMIPDVFNIELDSNNKMANVVVKNEFIAPLIGKKGSHMRLLEKITGWKISFIPYSEYGMKIAEKKKVVDQILGINENEEVEFIEEESIPLEMLPFSEEQLKVLKNAGFTDVAEIIGYEIEELSQKCGITLDEAEEIWKIIDENIEIEDKIED